MKTEEINKNKKKKQTDTSPIPPVRAPNGLPRAGPEPYKGAFRIDKGLHFMILAQSTAWDLNIVLLLDEYRGFSVPQYILLGVLT